MKRKYGDHEYIQMVKDDEEYGPVWSCVDCGDSAESPEKVKHNETCVPGISDYWCKYYEEAEKEAEKEESK